MAKKSEEARSYPIPMDFFVQKLRNINQAGLNVVLKSENPTPTGVWFRIHHGVSFTSYGEKITVTLQNSQGGTGVHILSECGMPTQIVDWGKNASNVRAVFEYLERGMPAAGQYAAPAAQPVYSAPQAAAQPAYAAAPAAPAAYAAPQAAAPAAQPAEQTRTAPVQNQTKRFCANCGAPITPGAKFCGHCGAKLS